MENIELKRRKHSTFFHNILRAAASAMEIPVVICQLLLAFSVLSLGWWLAELLGERRGGVL